MKYEKIVPPSCFDFFSDVVQRLVFNFLCKSPSGGRATSAPTAAASSTPTASSATGA
jgi:hypothetical protein